MSQIPSQEPLSTERGFGRIDLTDPLDVDYWCRIFQVDNEALRIAVQAVGPQPESVSHYLQARPAH